MGVVNFILNEEKKTAEQYIAELRAIADTASDKAIREAVDALTERRISEIRSTVTEVEIPGICYYVASDGCDENDGLSPEKPWKTLKRVHTAEELKVGDGVFFKRGDTFRGEFTAKTGVTYSAYGNGAKPLLTASARNYADESLWKETDEPNVWEYAEPVHSDIGSIVFDDEYTPRKVYISVEADGRHLDYRARREFYSYHDLVEDMTFFHENKQINETKEERVYSNKLYIRCEKGNPGSLAKNIEMSPKTAVIRVPNDVHIDNLCLAYTAFGVSSGCCRGLTVTNCEFKWIGGSIQRGPLLYSVQRSFATPFGNGIEIYGEAVDFTVDNCYFWQIYDAAVTHQRGRHGYTTVNNKHIRYINNVMEHCVYSVEIFYGESPLENRSNDDTLVANNILRKGGGFGHDARPDEGVTALIRHGSIIKNTTNYFVRNNIFDRSRESMVSTVNASDGGSKAQYFDNIYIQNKGGRFCKRFGKEYVADENVAEALIKTGTEHNPKVILTEEVDF